MVFCSFQGGRGEGGWQDLQDLERASFHSTNYALIITETPSQIILGV